MSYTGPRAASFQPVLYCIRHKGSSINAYHEKCDYSWFFFFPLRMVRPKANYLCLSGILAAMEQQQQQQNQQKHEDETQMVLSSVGRSWTGQDRYEENEEMTYEHV